MASYHGVRCVQLPSVRTRELSTLSHGFAAAAWARAARHDAVLVVNVANAASASLLRASGGRTVLNTDGQEWIRGKWGPLARRAFLLSATISRWGANALVSDCAAMRDLYRERFGADSTVVPYCWTELEPAPVPAALAGFGVGAGGYCLAAGRLVPENNIVEMAAAYAGVESPLPLVVLGAAPPRSPVLEQLEDLAAGDPRIRLAGHVDDRAVFAALVANAAAYLHGHSVGGINPSLLEAMGCGARIVALDTPFNRQALGAAGTYFTLGPDGAGFGDAVGGRLAEPADTTASYREAARKRARDHFSLAAVADGYERVLAAAAGLSSRWATTRLATAWDED